MLFLIVTLLGLEENRWSYILSKMNRFEGFEADEEDVE